MRLKLPSWVDLDSADSTWDCTWHHVAGSTPCWPDCSDRLGHRSGTLDSGEWPLGSCVHTAYFHTGNVVGIVADR